MTYLQEEKKKKKKKAGGLVMVHLPLSCLVCALFFVWKLHLKRVVE